MCTVKNTEQESFTYEYLCLTNIKKEETLGVTIENNLNFNNYAKKNCTKAAQNFSGLSKLAGYLHNDKIKIL